MDMSDQDIKIVKSYMKKYLQKWGQFAVANYNGNIVCIQEQEKIKAWRQNEKEN